MTDIHKVEYGEPAGAEPKPREPTPGWVDFIADLEQVCCSYQHSETDTETEAEALAKRWGLPYEVGPLALESCAHWHRGGYCLCWDRDDHGEHDWPLNCEPCAAAERRRQEDARERRAAGPPSAIETVSWLFKRRYADAGGVAADADRAIIRLIDRKPDGEP